MALIGNGAQSEFQAIAFHHLLGIRELRLFDTDAQATAKLIRNLHALNFDGLVVRACASTSEAVRGADIVTTVTADKRNATILTPEMVEPGMHLNAVGGDCPGKTELDADILLRPDARVIVEYAPQSRIEGEIQQMPADFPVTEFADIVASGRSARQSAAEVTIFDSVGFALEDYSALRLLRDRAAELGLGETIGLIPGLADPKDLYGHLMGEAAAASGARRAA